MLPDLVCHSSSVLVHFDRVQHSNEEGLWTGVGDLTDLMIEGEGTVLEPVLAHDELNLFYKCGPVYDTITR